MVELSQDGPPPAAAAFNARQIGAAADRFEPVGAETRVTVEHRGWDSVPQDHLARHGFPLNLTNQRQGEQWRAGLEAVKARALTISGPAHD